MPKLFLDSQRNVHYTVIHLSARDGELDSTVFLIKFRGAEWLKHQGAQVGQDLPEGAFRVLFDHQWLYPNKGLTPPEASPSQPLPPHAQRPGLFLDQKAKVHFTVLQMPTRDGRLDSTVFLITPKGTQWLKKRDVGVGHELPDGAFRALFERRWLYADPDPLPSYTPASRHQDKTDDSGWDAGCVGLLFLIVVLFLVYVLVF